MPPTPDHTAARVTRFVKDVVARIGAGLSRSAINRRVLGRLSHMSDRELADSGLVRQDLIEASEPNTGDPIGLLLERRAMRRAKRRV